MIRRAIMKPTSHRRTCVFETWSPWSLIGPHWREAPGEHTSIPPNIDGLSFRLTAACGREIILPSPLTRLLET